MQFRKLFFLVSILLMLFIQTTLSRVSKTSASTSTKTKANAKLKSKFKVKANAKRNMKDDIKSDKASMKHTKRPSENNGFSQEAKHVSKYYYSLGSEHCYEWLH